MQNTQQDTWRESIDSLACRPQSPQYSASPVEIYPEDTVKIPQGAPPAYTSAPCLDSSYPALDTPVSRSQCRPLTFHFVSPAEYLAPLSSSARSSFSSSPSSDNEDDEDEDEENVQRARLLLPSPCDAPPPYSSVERHFCRATLLHHVSRCSADARADEEAALERLCADEVRFEVERVVAMAVVMALVMLAGLLVGMVVLRR